MREGQGSTLPLKYFFILGGGGEVACQYVLDKVPSLKDTFPYTNQC